MPRIGIVGDHDPANPTHVATTAALRHCAAEPSWVPTPDVTDERLARFDGLLIAPGSPYRSIDGALAAITYARRHDVALLGTCGGFQHVVLEFARNVLGFTDAQHAEYDPYASTLFVSPLACSLAGQTMSVQIAAGSRAAAAYGRSTTTEHYYCNFSLNPAYLNTLVHGGLVVTGTDADGEPRILELPGNRFFVATLFVPQTSSTPEHPHPLVTALVAAAATATDPPQPADCPSDFPTSST